MAAPGANPVAMPVCATARPSLNRAVGTERSINDVAPISVGEMPKPVTKSAAAISGTLVTNGIGTNAKVNSSAPHRIRWIGPLVDAQRLGRPDLVRRHDRRVGRPWRLLEAIVEALDHALADLPKLRGCQVRQDVTLRSTENRKRRGAEVVLQGRNVIVT